MDKGRSRRGFLGFLGLGSVIALGWRGGGSAEAASARFPVQHSDAEWKRLLGAQRFHVLRQAGTERPYSSPLNREHRRGHFDCAGCNQRLFESAAKFDSGTGWPSFFQANRGAVETRTDRSFMMTRTEVLCSRCGGHLGHVFDDGPRPTGKRYCMNGLALTFRPA